MTNHETPPAPSGIVDWLIGPARQNATPEEVVGGVAERLVESGVPLLRVRIGQSVANPLISAWGVIWSREGGPESYTVPRGMLATGSYEGSPFKHVITTRKSYHRSLENLVTGQDHAVLFELAESGSTDYLAMPVAYGDGSVQACAFTTDRPGGFSDSEIGLIESLAPAIGAALEPAAMRHSMASLLQVYLGSGPAERIGKGAFRRGQTTAIDAAVLITDLRDSSGMSERLDPDTLLKRLDAYFEVVVDAIRAQGGDVLKFVGDGVLAVFPADEEGSRPEACRRAARAVLDAFACPAAAGMRFVAALHVGPVVYGNIGSLDRLDFTVVGPTVNYLSRLEGVAKTLDRRAVCSREVAAVLPDGATRSLGSQTLKGFAEPREVFELWLPDGASS
ncbi:adenylate/guanylate cyclase domain-containing protein [Mesorhizobium sp. KR9-304]|uniref:adenylate/guanylate cyclase domain-containing protein n=1 Tax=Mesorhizobium sp. KR9-304 TaxID=3156614 RepID=UPI0032B48B8C